MKYNTIIAVVVIIASIASHIRPALAEMEDKTKAEIAEESILIVRGEVLLVERFKLLDEYISIYKATVAISDVVKGVPETGSGNKVSIFFRNATQEGVYAEHSPRLKAGDKCVFYSKVKQGIIEGKEVYWLDSAKRASPWTLGKNINLIRRSTRTTMSHFPSEYLQIEPGPSRGTQIAGHIHSAKNIQRTQCELTSKATVPLTSTPKNIFPAMKVFRQMERLASSGGRAEQNILGHHAPSQTVSRRRVFWNQK